MTHLGQRLSALIDGELEASEREHVLIHVTKCGSCRDEVAALRMLKRRMNALGEAAAGAALTGKLMGLSESVLAGRMPMAEAVWPAAAPGRRLAGSRSGQQAGAAGRQVLPGRIADRVPGRPRDRSLHRWRRAAGTGPVISRHAIGRRAGGPAATRQCPRHPDSTARTLAAVHLRHGDAPAVVAALPQPAPCRGARSSMPTPVRFRG